MVIRFVLSFLKTTKMKANSLEELVTNSNILGDLRNNTDWHTRLVKFAQLVADWQKEKMMKDAIEGKVFMSFAPGHNQMVMADVDLPANTKVRVIVLKAEEE